MKTTYKYLLLAGLVVLAASCEKEIEKESPADATTGKMITETISAQIEGETKATVDADAKFAWTVGDKIAVHVSSGEYIPTAGASVAAYEANFAVTYVSGNTRDAFAIFPSNIVAPDAENYGQAGHTLDVTLPSTYPLAAVSGEKTPCPMIATNTPGAGWTFSQLCGLLRLTITNIPTGTNKIKLDFNGKKVNGAFSIASPVMPGTSIEAADSETEGDDIIWITGITGTADLTVNIPLPTGETYSDLIVSAWNDGVALRGQVVAFNTYTPDRAHGKKLIAALNLGAVSIASDKYAVFAPGNLQATYNGSSWTWDFAAHQYDTIGDGGESTVGNEMLTISSPYISAPGTVDLFGWVGSNSSFDGVASFGVNSSITESDYGNNPHYADNSAPVESFKSDWGKLEIGDYDADIWRTPTTADLGYLLSTRSSASSKKGTATVGGVNGLIVLPDSFSDPNTNGGSNSFEPFEAGKEWGTMNIYTIGGNWEAMETAGAVFLPTTGLRDEGTTITVVGLSGRYRTSSIVEDSQYGNYVLIFSKNTINNTATQSRTGGYAVRLIRDLN